MGLVVLSRKEDPKNQTNGLGILLTNFGLLVFELSSGVQFATKVARASILLHLRRVANGQTTVNLLRKSLADDCEFATKVARASILLHPYRLVIPVLYYSK